MPEQTEPLTNDPTGTGDLLAKLESDAANRVQLSMAPAALWGLVGVGGTSVAVMHLAAVLVTVVSDRIEAAATTPADLFPAVVVVLLNGLVLVAFGLAVTLLVFPLGLMLHAANGGDDARRALGLAPRGTSGTRTLFLGVLFNTGIYANSILTTWAKDTGLLYLHALGWLSMWLPLLLLYLIKLMAVLPAAKAGPLPRRLYR